MGLACCVAARSKSLLPSSSDGPSRNARYSPTWSCGWDNQGRVSDELENHSSVYSQGSGSFGFETKDSVDVDCGDLSEADLPTPVLQNSPPPQHSAAPYALEQFMESSSLDEVKDLKEPSAVADPSASRLSFPPPVTSCSVSTADLLQRHSLPDDSNTLWQAHHSPNYHLLGKASDCQYSDLKSPNNSVSEGRESFMLSTCSNDLTLGSQGGGSSDGWSMSTFSELVASSQKESWSFDSETMESARGKVTRSNSSFLASPSMDLACGKVTRSNSSFLAPSVDLRTCGVCLKLLTEKSPWVSQKFIVSNELSVVAVLTCGHAYHADCLENTTPETYRFDPPCPVCTTGDKHSLKIHGKTVKIDTNSKARNRLSKTRVIDSNHEFDYSVPDHWRSTRRAGKSPMLSSSSSMKSTLAMPFLKRHFSLGSKGTKSILENEFSIKSPSKKGFWSRYHKR